MINLPRLFAPKEIQLNLPKASCFFDILYTYKITWVKWRCCQLLVKLMLLFLTEQNQLFYRINELSTLYQGEDVAMGIWLEKFNAQRHVGEACYWACNKHCHVNTCNVMQLSVQDVYNMWEHYKTCGNKICKCPIR